MSPLINFSGKFSGKAFAPLAAVTAGIAGAGLLLLQTGALKGVKVLADHHNVAATIAKYLFGLSALVFAIAASGALGLSAFFAVSVISSDAAALLAGGALAMLSLLPMSWEVFQSMGASKSGQFIPNVTQKSDLG